jgi:hypothetical protein
VCGVAQPKGTHAWWSPSTRDVYCSPCVGGADLALSEAGTAGAAAAREYARRHANDKAAMRARWGILAPVVEQFAGPRQSTHAWARGAAGEERLAAYLERELGDEAILLHDRRIPASKANIDHIAVAPSGVWVIDAKRHTGTVRRHDRGGLLRTDVRVYVGGRDQTQLVRKLPPQIDAVSRALSAAPVFSALEVRGALCFTDSDWGFLNLGKPFTIEGVIVTYPGALRKTLREPVRLSRDVVGQVAARLAVAIPSA